MLNLKLIETFDTVPTKEPGYVYILTNPSFREDWVKIGKSSRPVDIVRTVNVDAGFGCLDRGV